MLDVANNKPCSLSNATGIQTLELMKHSHHVYTHVMLRFYNYKRPIDGVN